MAKKLSQHYLLQSEFLMEMNDKVFDKVEQCFVAAKLDELLSEFPFAAFTVADLSQHFEVSDAVIKRRLERIFMTGYLPSIKIGSCFIVAHCYEDLKEGIGIPTG